jgi:flagellar biosynthetic protein FliR
MVRVGLAGMLSLLLTPVLAGRLPRLPSDPVALAAALLGELAVGAVLGLAVRMLFAGMSLAGELTAVQMGIGLPGALDPHSQLQVSSVNQLLDQIALLTFLLVGGHHVVLAGMAQSLTVVPPRSVSLGGAAMEYLVRLFGTAFDLAIRLAAPVGAAMLATMVTLGLLNRMAPQVNVFAVSFTLTVGVGILVLWAALPVLEAVWVGRLAELPALFLRLLAGMRHGL